VPGQIHDDEVVRTSAGVEHGAHRFGRDGEDVTAIPGEDRELARPGGIRPGELSP